MPEPMTDDTVKFLELLLSECVGCDAHSWRKCRRCLAFHELENHQPLARGFVKWALEALRQRQQNKEFNAPEVSS